MENENKIVFQADKVTLSKMRADGTIEVAFSCGEYQHEVIRDFIGSAFRDKMLTVAVVAAPKQQE